MGTATGRGRVAFVERGEWPMVMCVGRGCVYGEQPERTGGDWQVQKGGTDKSPPHRRSLETWDTARAEGVTAGARTHDERAAYVVNDAVRTRLPGGQGGDNGYKLGQTGAHKGPPRTQACACASREAAWTQGCANGRATWNGVWETREATDHSQHPRERRSVRVGELRHVPTRLAVEVPGGTAQA